MLDPVIDRTTAISRRGAMSARIVLYITGALLLLHLVGGAVGRWSLMHGIDTATVLIIALSFVTLGAVIIGKVGLQVERLRAS